MIKGIEHIALYSDDTKALADWYAKYLGVKIVSDNGKGVYFIAFPDGSMLELVKTDSKNQPTGLEVPGIRHLAIAVDDFEEAEAKIREADTEILQEPVTAPNGAKTMFFRDIDGNILHFIKRPKPLV